jgi:tape measure domain-containing protein
VSVVANVAINVDSSGAVSKLRQVQQGAQATSQAVDKLNATTAATGNKFRGAGSSASALAASLGKLAAAYLTLQTAQRAVQAGIQREESGRRLTFLAQGYNEVAQAQQAAARAGKQFGLSTTESNQQFAQLYGRLRPLNTSLTDIEAAFIGFNTAAKVSGTTAAESAGALLQLTQALGSGVLRGQELNSVLEQAPGLVVALTQELGTPISQIRKLAEEGKITSDVVIRALKRAGTEGAGQLAEAMKGPAQQVKNLQNAFQDFQVAITRDVLPAFIGIIKGATELFRLFGQLPGPMKTIIAAAIGLTAAFVALAPAISAAIGLLGGLSLATLAAAGPWIALAAGITAAVVALAGYRSESEKIGAKAAAGDPAALAAARNRMVSKQQEVSLLAGQRPGPRSSRGGDLANARRELAQLKRDVAIGETAAVGATASGNAMGTPIGATVGGGGGARGKTDAERAAEKAAEDAKRLAEQTQQQLKAADDINFALKNRLAIAQETESVAKRMLEYDIRQNEIAKEYDELKKAAKGADELALINANLVIENRIAQIEAEQQINDLLAERAALMADVVRQTGMPTVYNELEEQDAALQSVLDKYPAIGAAADAAATLATSGISEMIAGTKSAEQVFVEFLSSIADALINTAKQMIAQYIAIGIAKMFAGLSGGGGGNFAPSGPLAAVGDIGTGFNFDAGAMITPFAEGGFVTGPTNAVIGEGGESEYVIPASKMNAAMSRYGRGARGEGVIAGNGTTSEGGAPAAAGPVAIDVRYSVERINNVEYVTASQFQEGMRQAAQQGAAQGEQRTLRRLQQSPSTRKRIGV